MNNDLYRGWVSITYLKEGAYTTVNEYKSWNSYFDLVKDLSEGLVEFKVSVNNAVFKGIPC